MAEKVAAKKQNENNKKKNKTKEKKESEKHHTRPNDEALKEKKKKEKKNEKPKKGNNKQSRRSNNKPSGKFFGSLRKVLCILLIFVPSFLGFLYVVDIEKYRFLRDKGMSTLTSVVHMLPAELVTKGQLGVEYVRPAVEFGVSKFLVLASHLSSILNTNPVLKDHWSNINEISSVIGERLAEYMRTVYRQIPVLYDNAKNK